MPRSGFGGATTCTPSFCRRSTTPFQLDASAKAPCTSTTVRESLLEFASAIRAPYLVDVDFDDCFGKGLRSLLREVVTDASCDGPVGIPAGELLRVGVRVRMRRAVGIAFEGDRRNGDR